MVAVGSSRVWRRREASRMAASFDEVGEGVGGFVGGLGVLEVEEA